MLSVLIVLISFVSVEISGARILGIIPTPSFSHQFAYQPLWRQLSLRGHQVTVLTTDPIKDLALINLTEIDLKHTYELVDKLNILEMSNMNPIQIMRVAFKFGKDVIDTQMEHPQVKQLIKNSKEHFDVLLVEGNGPVMYYFAEHFRCPLIVLMPLEASVRDYRAMGNPTNSILYPDILLPFSAPLNFGQRLTSVIFDILIDLAERWILFPADEQQVKKYFGNGHPSIAEMKEKVSLMFTNSHPLIHPVRPLLPNIIEVGGGTHLLSQKPLPQQLKERLDSCSQHGFVYFSLGSNVKGKYLSDQNHKTILNALGQLAQLVLWKFELDDLPNKPSNVIISKWFPQQDILKHPNIRLFITQGGLQSIEESVYSHVPMVVIPFFGDQNKNARTITTKGWGLELDKKTLTEDVLKSAIEEVIRNPKYKDSVIKSLELAKDQPMSGLEKAVWWTEYIIRHKGADHLRSPVLDLEWYQYYMLDVMLFAAVTPPLIFYILGKLVRFSVRTIKRLFAGTKKEKSS